MSKCRYDVLLRMNGHTKELPQVDYVKKTMIVRVVWLYSLWCNKMQTGNFSVNVTNISVEKLKQRLDKKLKSNF